MTKFLDALEVQLDPGRRVKAIIPEFLGEPMNLTHDFVNIGHVDRYTVSINWHVPIWLRPPVLDSQLYTARKEAMSVLKGKIYGEIHAKLAEIKYLVKYNDSEKALESIQSLMIEIMS